jgi:hypothetical protein
LKTFRHKNLRRTLVMHVHFVLIEGTEVPQHTYGGACIAPTHSRPLALDGGEWSASRPGRALAPGKGPRVPIGHEAMYFLLNV